MRRPMWVLAITALLLVAGGSWLAALVWKTSTVGGKAMGPHIVGALLGGFTLAQIAQRRSFVLASSAALVWIGLQLLVHKTNGVAPKWAVATSLDEYSVLLALAPACAGIAAAFPLPGAETRWRWFWTSALLTLGAMVTPLVATTHQPDTPVIAIIFIVCSPLIAGALTQYLATYRMIWTCGGGSLIFALFILDQRRWTDADSFIGPLAGICMYAAVGACGAALSWRLLRNKDPRAPTLPTAKAT